MCNERRSIAGRLGAIFVYLLSDGRRVWHRSHDFIVTPSDRNVLINITSVYDVVSSRWYFDFKLSVLLVHDPCLETHF